MNLGFDFMVVLADGVLLAARFGKRVALEVACIQKASESSR